MLTPWPRHSPSTTTTTHWTKILCSSTALWQTIYWTKKVCICGLGSLPRRTVHKSIALKNENSSDFNILTLYVDDENLADWGIEPPSTNGVPSDAGTPNAFRFGSRDHALDRDSHFHYSDETVTGVQTKYTLATGQSCDSDMDHVPLSIDRTLRQTSVTTPILARHILGVTGQNPPLQPFRSRHRARKSQTAMQPLLLSSEGSALLMRQERFTYLVQASLFPELTKLENARFLERFRYALVSSPLLDKQLLGYTAKLMKPTGKGHRVQKSLSECNCEKKQHEKKYWTSSGCVIVVVVLLTYAIKESKYGLVPGAPLRTVALVVISFGVTLFLFAHSRKRLLRNLRSSVLFNTAQLVESSQHFDLAITKCLSIIREAELMSHGYRPDLVDEGLEGLGLKLEAPASRIEMSRDGIIMGKHLRSTISAGLYLCTTTCLTAVQELLSYCNESDLEKYLEIYEIDLRDIDEFGWESTHNKGSDEGFHELIKLTLNVPREEFYGASGANASLAKIKLDLFKLHFLRRLLICCLLSMQTTGRCEPRELDAWHLVDLHLENMSNLSSQLSKTITPHRVMSSIGMQKSKATDKTRTTSWQRQVRSLNNISSTLQHIEARMEMLRDTSVSLINTSSPTTMDLGEDSEQEDDFGENNLPTENDIRHAEDDFEHNFEMIGSDIRALLDLWETGRKDLKSAITTRRGRDTTNTAASENGQQNSEKDYKDLLSPVTDSGSVLTDLSTALTSPISKKGGLGFEDFQSHHRRQSSEFTSLSGATVLEGISDVGMTSRNNRHGLGLAASRAERIKKMQAERANEAERKRERMAMNSLVEELGSVLDYRRRVPGPSPLHQPWAKEKKKN